MRAAQPRRRPGETLTASPLAEGRGAFAAVLGLIVAADGRKTGGKQLRTDGYAVIVDTTMDVALLLRRRGALAPRLRFFVLPTLERQKPTPCRLFPRLPQSMRP